MFVIFTYDVNSKRVQKIMKICKKYLVHIQNSVFEGYITNSKLEKLKKEVTNIIDKNVDSICIYKFASIKYASKEQIGNITAFDNIIM